ncbi:MAG: translation initiation factor translation initiation factor [Patescibacteria group bacterium]|nr:translation initiation factor translation initiation factor [Patescibacteria group bacterium]
MVPNKDEKNIVTAEVLEALPNAMFRVRFQDGTEQVSYLSGKMKLHRIKVLIGDTVHVLLEPYGGKGRIVKRA